MHLWDPGYMGNFCHFPSILLLILNCSRKSQYKNIIAYLFLSLLANPGLCHFKGNFLFTTTWDFQFKQCNLLIFFKMWKWKKFFSHPFFFYYFIYFYHFLGSTSWSIFIYFWLLKVNTLLLLVITPNICFPFQFS